MDTQTNNSKPSRPVQKIVPLTPPLFPTATELGIRKATQRVYAVLQRPEGATMNELRDAVEADGKLRSVDAMHVMLRRLHWRLNRHDIAIARIVGELTYRLVPR